MEDILAKVMKDASTSKHANIKRSCLESQELLSNQHGLMRSPPFELRGKILETLQLALESKHSKLVSDALSGFQRMIWDKSFQSVYEIDDEENWLPIQLMNAVTSLNTQSDEVQIEILKILLNMTTSYGQSLTSRSIIMLICLCSEVYSNTASGVRTAAQVTVSQTLTSFCTMLQETDAGVEDQTDDSDAENGFNLLESVAEEIYPVLHCTCEKLKNIDCNRSKNGSPLLLQCILSVLKNLKIDIHDSQELINFLWQELCPLLIALLGSPKTDKNIISSQKSCDVNEIGRGSGCLATAPSCLGVEAKTVYSIAVELVRLVGSVGSLRPVLESLFHRMLLYPPVQHRLEALKSIKELFSKPDLLLQLASPPLHATSDKDWISLDLDLIKIAIDSLGECCYSSDNSVCYTSVSCISALLKSLEDICCGEIMKQDIISCINSQFKTLESSDYKGAKSERWLKTKLKYMLDEKTKRDLVRSKMAAPSKEISNEGAETPLQHMKNDMMDLKSDNCTSNESKVETKETAEMDVEKTETISINNNQITNEDTLTPALDNVEISSSQQENTTEKSELRIEDTNNVDIEQSLEDSDSHGPDHQKNNSEQLTSPKRTLEYYISAEIGKTSEKSPPDSYSSSSEGDEENKEEVKEKENIKVTELDLNSINLNNNESAGLHAQNIVSPVTESAEEALDYVESKSSDDLSDDFEGDDFDDATDDVTEDADRLKRVPRTLLGQEDAGKEERERVEKLCLARLEFAQKERQNAQHFVNVLQAFLPELLAIRSSIEADQALQEFASKYCEDLWQSQQIMKKEQENIPSHVTILNADGIYLSLYSALLLNLKLVRNNYYKEMAGEIPLSEQQFIEEVHGSGVLVYLSATWLAELYQQVLACNLLEKAGYNPASVENSALVNLLSGLLFGTDDWWIKNISDIDGLGNSLPGTQQLADYRRLEKAVVNNQSSPNIEAGKKFSRRILTCCWETILEVLSVLLNGTNSCGISGTLGFLLGTEGAKEEHRRTKDAIAESLDGLQRAAKLCNNLGLQSCCNSVFSQLATASCPLSEDMLFPQLSSKLEGRQFKKSLLSGRSKTLRLHSSQILSMDVLLSKGLELGSHSPDCWKYVFQCCLFVLQLENTYFSGHGSVQSSLTRTVLNTSQDSQMLNMPSCDYNMPSMPGSTSRKLDISETIKENRGFSHTSDVLKDHKLLEAIEALSQQVDRLFEEAASRLNLSALISFLVELCAASQIQLFTQSHARLSCSGGHSSNLLLYHLGDVMLRCARGGRPLVHIMKAWSVVAPHFVEASCHKESLISKKGVSTIHDIVSALLSSNSELPHFHFNEALFKPFENLLCLELCDMDVQEQIVSSICEFVEGCTTEIRSGWRPLFGALRTVQIPSVISNQCESSIERDRIHHLQVVLDVFEAFLATDNVFVFAYAAVDCLLCLLKHVRGPAVELDSSHLDVVVDYSNEPSVPVDMSLAALKYLEKCSDILSSMYQIPTCPVFNSAHRIHLYSEPSLVDPAIPGMDIIYFEEPDTVSISSSKSDYEPRYEDMGDLKALNDIPGINDVPVSLSSLDKSTGIIHVWFLLIEGLVGTLATCPKQYQSATMETLFKMLQNLKDVPGPEFGIFCINHLLLPMLQQWLRRTTRLYKGWENFATNFKQCCGLATDLIVDYIQIITDISIMKVRETGTLLMFNQLLLVLTECVAQQTEIISRLGCSCLRHAVMSAGGFLTGDMWDILCLHLKRACRVSLHSVKQLMACFHVDSDNFYGDIGEVKVAARKDCSLQEYERLRQLSHQVFLLDCQQSSVIVKPYCVEDDDRSFTFLLFPPGFSQNDPDSAVIRVPFCSLVVGLLSHQILLQTLGSILLQGTKYMLPTLMALLPSESCIPSPANGKKKPGFLSRLTNKQLKILFSSLDDAYETACNFDRRPGLKFLVQKVAQTNVATNLYKQAGISWTIQMVVLFELCMSVSNLNLEFVKGKLISESCEETFSEKENSMNSEVKDSFSSDPSILEFVMLRNKFKEICETYTELTIDKEGLPNIVDRLCDQPIFFLAAPTDDSDIVFPSRQNDLQTSLTDSSNELPPIQYCDSSDDEEIAASKEGAKDKIYTLATERTINSLVSEYKKRKNQHSMPSKMKEKLSRKSSSISKQRNSSSDSVPEEILNQRRNSIIKDGEAQLQVFKQLIQSFLDLHRSLSEEHFKALLPVFFPGVQFLVAYATDGELRLSISEWLQQMAVTCNFFVDSCSMK